MNTQGCLRNTGKQKRMNKVFSNKMYFIKICKISVLLFHIFDIICTFVSDG